MSEITPTEAFIVSLWRQDRYPAVEAFIGASRYASAICQFDDAEDLIFCARIALDAKREDIHG